MLHGYLYFPRYNNCRSCSQLPCEKALGSLLQHIFRFDPTTAPALFHPIPTASKTMSAFGAPPPQTMAMPNIQTYDDDDILMDYEDDFPASAPAPAQTNGNADTMMMDTETSTAAATRATSSEEDVMVPERVHLRGVDNVRTHSSSPPSLPAN